MITTRKKYVFIALAIVLAFLCIEVGVRVFLFVSGSNLTDSRDQKLLATANLKIVRETDWGQEYFLNEVQKLGTTIMDPLLGWRPPEFHGKYLNIDANGERKTWNPQVTSSSRIVNVWMFGGSTLWGAGSRDEFTIPSMISKKLNSDAKNGLTYVVHNYGEPGYTNIMETQKLLLLLEDGKRPDVVIFYEGGNDVAGEYQMGVAGPAGQELAVLTGFKTTFEPTLNDQISALIKGPAKALCATCRVLFDAVRSVNTEFWNPNVIVGSHMSDSDLEKLASDIASQYKNKTITFLNGEAKAFDFKLSVFWQPTIFTEDQLIGEENTIGNYDEHVRDKKAPIIFKAVSAGLPTDAKENFYNITDVLYGRTRECYEDFIHISEECDGTVSQRMYDIVKDKYHL